MNFSSRVTLGVLIIIMSCVCLIETVTIVQAETYEQVDEQFVKITFEEADIILQGNWLVQLGSYLKTQANLIVTTDANQKSIAQIIFNNGDKIVKAGEYLMKNPNSVTATESIQLTGESLKAYGNSLFIASEVLRTMNVIDEKMIAKLATIGQSLESAADTLYNVGYQGFLNDENINLKEYEEAMNNVDILYQSYEALRKSARSNSKSVVTAKLISSQAVKNQNNTYQVIYFDGTSSSDPYGTIDSTNGYFWDFGDKTFGSGPYITHRYTEPGKYVVKLLVNGPSGFDLTSTEIKVDAVKPVAVLTTNKESVMGPNAKELTIYAEEAVQFSGSGSFDPSGKTEKLTYEWDFGDGSHSTGIGNSAVTHRYAKPGEYEAILVVISDKLSDTANKKVIVLPTPPSAIFRVRKSDSNYWDNEYKNFYSDVIGNGLELEFDGTMSLGSPLNEDKTRFSDLSQFKWEFGDSGKAEQNVNDIIAGKTVKYTYKKSGTYTVTLSVRDTLGQENIVKKVLYISENTQPIADLNMTFGTSFDTHSVVTLDGSDSRTLEGIITDFNWEIINMDKSTFGTYNDKTVIFTPQKPGEYEIHLQVKNSTGIESPTIVQMITIDSAPPVANFTMEFLPGSANEVILDASYSSDPDPDDFLTYSWDFNSDTEFEINRFTQPVVHRIFDTIGQNYVTLVVSDMSGKTDSIKQVIQITSTLMAKLEPLNSEAVGHAPLNITLQAKGYYNLLQGSDISNIRSIIWNFDDGTPQVTDTELLDGKSIQDHTFTKPGRYNVVAVVLDTKGNKVEAFYPIHVGDGVNPITAVEVTPASGRGTRTSEFTFDASKSVNSEGAITNLGFSWDFDDGSGIQTGSVVTHEFSKLGIYAVTLSLTDYETETITKLDIPIVIEDAGLVANFIASPLKAPTKTVIYFDSSSSFDSDNTITEYRWDFGDGSIERTPHTKVNHLYKEPGLYEVKLTVTNDAGVQQIAKTVIITIN